MAAYIKGASVISPQKTFTEPGFLNEIIDYTGFSRLKCIEPAYRDFLDPMASRRMSRIVRMGVCSALKCIQMSGIQMPDAIIAGSGLGCLEDTEKFLTSIYTQDEKLLNPTPFIQSTHNTVAGAIALAIKCHNYNATYTHRGFSFESALEDALLQLTENDHLNILAGSFDELTETSYNLTKRLGLWKKSIPGEGVAFFMLGGKPGPDDMARLHSVRVFFKPNIDEISSTINQFLEENGKKPETIDLVLFGISGDSHTDNVYHHLMQGTFRHNSWLSFKHLCGEYDTSSSFAMWLASMIVRHQQVPFAAGGDKLPESINTVLIYNHLRGVNHSLYLLERC